MSRCHCLLQPAVLALTDDPDWCVECSHPASSHQDAGGCTWGDV